MSFKVKLHSYGGAQAEEFKKTDSNKIGNFRTNNNNNKYEYQFSENVDPDVKKNPNKWFNEKDFADIIKRITGLKINLQNDANKIFKTTDNGRTGTIHLNPSDNKLLESLINLKDIKKNIKKNINLQEQQKLEVKKQARQAVQEAQLRAEAAEAAKARANEQIAQVKAKAAQAAQAAKAAQEAQEAQIRQIRTKADKQLIKCMNDRRKLKPVSVSEGEGDLILSLDFDNLNQFGGSKIMAVETDSNKPINLSSENGNKYSAYVGSKFINMTGDKIKLNEAQEKVKIAEKQVHQGVQAQQEAQVRAEAAQAAQVRAEAAHTALVAEITQVKAQAKKAAEAAQIAEATCTQIKKKKQEAQKAQEVAEATHKAQLAEAREAKEAAEVQERQQKKAFQKQQKKISKTLKALKAQKEDAAREQAALKAARKLEIDVEVEKQTEQIHQKLTAKIQNKSQELNRKSQELEELRNQISLVEEASKKSL